MFAEENLGSFGDVLAVEASAELAEQLIVGPRVEFKNHNAGIDGFVGQ